MRWGFGGLWSATFLLTWLMVRGSPWPQHFVRTLGGQDRGGWLLLTLLIFSLLMLIDAGFSLGSLPSSDSGEKVPIRGGCGVGWGTLALCAMVGVGSIGNPDAFEGLLCGALLGLIMGIAACLAVESLMLGAAVLGSLAGFPLAGLILQFEFLEMFAWEILVGSLVAGGVAGMGLCQWLTRSKDESPTPVFVAGLLIALFTGLAGGLSLTLIEYI